MRAARVYGRGVVFLQRNPLGTKLRNLRSEGKASFFFTQLCP